MGNIKSVWDFVEKYYPNYSSCDEIMRNNDLQKIIDGEINGGAEILHAEIENELLDKNGISPEDFEIQNEIEYKLDYSNLEIFEKSIKGYIETLKN